VAANAILVSLDALGMCAEAVERGELLLQQRPSRFDGGFLLNFYLNLAEANLKCGQVERAYASTMRSLEWTQRNRRDPVNLKRIERMLALILRESAKMQVTLNQDNAFDPGESAIKTWIARQFLERGEREEARKLLTLASKENPDDSEAVRLLTGINREDALNYAQIIKENAKQEYQSSPFSRFNASMALAYLVRTPDAPAPLRNLGEKLLDYALEIQPGVADAHLLKAYYLHGRKEIEPAIMATQRALALDPGYAKAWLALGYFRMELNDFPAALSVFRKGLELYPGCPQRQSVLAVINAIEQNQALAIAQNH
jgi:protein O-mannosyl-transferase